MAGSNAIGTGAVILTANSDKLAAGLDKAAKDVGRFAQKADISASKVGKMAPKKGLFGTLFSDSNIAGGVVGAAAKVGFEAIGKGVEVLADLFGNLQERAAKVQLAPDVRAGVMVADRSVRQLSNTWDTLLLTGVAKLAPMMERVAPAVEAILYVAEGLFEAAVDGIGDVVDSVAGWIDSTFDLSLKTDDAGKVMFDVFKKVAVAIGYAWDTMKAGIGVAAVVAGAVAKSMAQVARPVGGFLKTFGSIAKNASWLPLPPGLDLAAEVGGIWADQIGNGLDKVGENLGAWGVKAIGEWGQAAAQAAAWVDRVQDKFNNRVKVGMADTDPIKFAGAFDRGSKEAYSIAAKYQTESYGLTPDNQARRQEEALKVIHRDMVQLIDLMKNAQPLRVL